MLSRSVCYILAAAVAASARLRSSAITSFSNDDVVAASRNLSTLHGDPVILQDDKSILKVNVKQVWIGDPTRDCGAKGSAETTANRMVLVYQDPDTGGISCDRYAAVDACFERTMLIGCNTETRMAEMSIYVTDREFPLFLSAVNPQLPRECGLGDVVQMRRTLLHTASFPCAPTSSDAASTKCQDDSFCTDSEYCGLSSDEDDKHCMPYVSQDNAVCGGDFGIRCNPSSHYCHDADMCSSSSTPSSFSSGTCLPFGDTCQSSNDCDGSTQYCDSGRCKLRHLEGDCCQSDDQCGGGLCKSDGKNSFCTKTCDNNTDCPKGTWCGARNIADAGEERRRFCKPYASVGSGCGGYSQEPELCDPSVSFCFTGQSCIIADLQGECMAFGVTCSSSEDCEESAEYCDTLAHKCKPKLEQGTCCQADEQCRDGSVCSNVDGFQVCIPAKDSVHRPTQCSTDADCDTGLEFCTHSADLNGLYCRAYSTEDGPCGGDPSVGDETRCSLDAFCSRPQECVWWNAGDTDGKCKPLGSACTNHKDCGGTAFCDDDLQRCKPKQAPGDCCDTAEECDVGYSCLWDVERFGIFGPRFCVPTPAPCSDTTDCGDGQHCAYTTQLDHMICKDYSPDGGICGGGLTHPDAQGVCKPSSYCDSRRLCGATDFGGICQPYGPSCTSHSECDGSTEFCDSKRCVERVGEFGCCTFDEECLGDLVCLTFEGPFGDNIQYCSQPGSNYYGGPMASGGGPMASGGGPMPSDGGPMASEGGPMP